jgi:hypothetical protein
MRCPNPVCREVFEVKEEIAPTSENGQSEPEDEPVVVEPLPLSGNVADILPLLPAEQVDEPPAAPPAPTQRSIRRAPRSSSHVQEILPLLDAEAAAPIEPEPSREAASWHEWPQVPDPQSPAAEMPPGTEPPTKILNWQDAPPPPRFAGAPAPPAPFPETPPSAPRPSRPSRKAPPIKPAALAPPPPAPSPAMAPPPMSFPEPGPAVEAPRELQPGEWQAPPVRQPLDTSAAGGPPSAPEAEQPHPAEGHSPTSSADTMVAFFPGPLDLPPGEGQAPHVHQPDSTSITEAPRPELPTPPGAVEHDVALATAMRRRNRRLIGVIAAMVALVIGIGVVLYFQSMKQTQEDLRANAKKAYDAGNYSEAANLYHQLRENFPESEQAPRDEFFHRLSECRDQVSRASANPVEGLAKLRQFLKEHGDNVVLQEYKADIAQMYGKIIEDLAKLAQQKLDPNLLKVAEEALAESRPYASEVLIAELRVKINGAMEVLAAAEIQKRVKDMLAQLLKKKPLKAVDVADARTIVRRQNLADDGDVKELLAQLDELLRRQVTYTPVKNGELPDPKPEDTERGLLVAPSVGEHSGLPGGPPVRVVFALARGVLWALDRSDGHVRWATRVGLDITMLPLRLPAKLSAPERVLVLSSDTNTLTARRVTDGKALWQHRLRAPCLSRPVLVEDKAYIPTISGQIEEIEIVQGKLLGWYQLTQRLIGGVRQEGTNLLYFPAESRSVYVIDVASTDCVAVLQTEHPAGSLRGEPLIVSWEDPVAPPNTPRPGYLILEQTDGFDAMKLRVYDLPIKSATAPPLVEQRIHGWSWLPPYSDGESVFLATDAGMLGLFGIRQQHNDDPPLFARIELLNVGRELLPGEVDLFPAPRAEAHLENALRAGRAQVVPVDESDFCALVRGQLQRYHFDAFGQKLCPLWPGPLRLGSPLHGSQFDENDQILVVVTKSPNGQACLATAVDTRQGKIYWQRQLGLVCQAEPRAFVEARPESLGVFALDAAAGLPATLSWAGLLQACQPPVRLVALDQDGGLSAYDSSHFQYQPEFEWHLSSKSLADPLQEPKTGPMYFLRGSAGQTIFSIASTFDAVQNKHHLLVQRCEAGRQNSEMLKFELPFPLSGRPGLLTDALVLPLADGNLYAQPLKKGTRSEPFATWRAKRANLRSLGHVIALGDGSFFTTDGLRTVTRWRPANPLPIDEKKVELPAQIVAAPVLVPPAEGEAVPRLCVADAQGTVTLLRSDNLAKLRDWPLGEQGGKVTAGPFARGQQIGCVVDHRLLVWLDPAQARPVWTYAIQDPRHVLEVSTVALGLMGQRLGAGPLGAAAALLPVRAKRGGIVGQPQLVGDCVLVADESGGFVGLDPATGEPRGKGYTLRASVAAAVAPVAFGPDRAFAPLTDGTVLLLSLRHFR